MRALLLTILLWLPATLLAGTGLKIEIAPAPAMAGEPITVTVTPLQTLCDELPTVVFPQLVEGNVLRIDLGGSDACVGSQEARQYTLAPLPAGNYIFRFEFCGGHVPPGQDPCFTLEEQAVTVLGMSEGPVTVPTLSYASALLLAVALALTSLGARARLR